ncbi:MAG: arsenosugar biosynthesis radical SAM protein ArsS [Bdellovibrionaceae bacterium]|nr:arsenosugar biosynthesis radical SAM protein ArsS [Pseudobdellovibrionaceae bacterium]
MSSLLSRNSNLSLSHEQIQLLEEAPFKLESFSSQLKKLGHFPLKPTEIDILQINMGKMCNQTCRHCHVDAGPDRKEIMSLETLEQCLEIIKNNNISTVDLTGGAPEMNPHFRWFVEQLSPLGVKTIDRCNLTIITANPKYNDLPQFLAQHNVEVVSSLPHYSQNHTDRQRGNGVFEKSIKALRMLNEVGYAKEGNDLKLNLVYNPVGCFLPGNQKSLEQEFKKRLRMDFGIEFNQLFCITNMPISRYLEYLIESGNYESYMSTLVNAFNPSVVKGVMCRNTLSIGWDGYIYDCDFNQMLDLKVESSAAQHVSDFDLNLLTQRHIRLGQHCYACTAGSGSSCGGETL